MAVDWSIEQLISETDIIRFAEKTVEIDLSTQELPLFVLLRFPTRKIMRLSHIEERKRLILGKKQNFMTEEEMELLLRKRGIWTEEDDDKVEEMREKIDKWKGKLTNPEIGERSKDLARELIPKLEEDLLKIEAKKENRLAQSLERVARQTKYDYMLWACAHDPETEDLLWANYLTFYREVERNKELKNKLLSEFLTFIVGHSTEEVRFIARSNLMRLDYAISQKGRLQLFPSSAVELTPDQKNLLWWIGYYQSLNDLLPEDQPDDWVIEDDEELDRFLDELRKERSKDRAERKAEKQYGASSAEKMATRLIMRSHPEYYDREYDKANPTGSEVSEISIDKDPAMEKASFRRSQSVSKSKKFSKEDIVE